MDIRTGIGIDFHRLVCDSHRPLFLGGVEIPGDLSIVGHSDADIVLHALSDAILGAMGEADIGEFFPNHDPKNKDLASTKILELALAKLKQANYQLSNVDLSLIGEKPNLSPFKAQICRSLAKLLHLSIGRVSIKATTTEGMGALGRSEGLGCIANVLLIKGK